jgi:iron complex transport system permease protein
MNRGAAIVFAALSLTLLLSAALELSLGPVKLPVLNLLPDAWDYFHGGRSTEDVVMGAIRLPRLLAAAAVGAGLAGTGTVLQAVFRNPMADPAMIGVSSGASLGAVITIQAGLSHLNQWSTPLGAFISGLTVVYTIYKLSTNRGRTAIYSLLLAGVAISSFCGAMVTLLLSLAPLESMQEMLFWLIGGLNGITWSAVGTVFIVVLTGLLLFMKQAHALDIVSIGEEQAEGVGVPLQRTKQIVLLTSAIVVGACVSVSGVIGFVGLIVPHLLRFWVGPRHQLLIPAAAIGGAALLILCDLIARMVFLPVELNVGVVTSCLGAPFFLYLLQKQDKRYRGG